MEQKGTLKYRKLQRTPQSGENAGKKKWYATAVTAVSYTHLKADSDMKKLLEKEFEGLEIKNKEGINALFKGGKEMCIRDRYCCRCPNCLTEGNGYN